MHGNDVTEMPENHVCMGMYSTFVYITVIKMGTWADLFYEAKYLNIYV